MGVQAFVVLTTHPTEAKRRTVMDHLLRIDRMHSRWEAEGMPVCRRADVENDIMGVLEALGLTEMTRTIPVTLEAEIDRILFSFRETIIGVVPLFYRRLEAALDQEPAGPGVFAFGSWVGGDRDGNPEVTPQLSLETVRKQRSLILSHYRRELGRLSRTLSHLADVSPVSPDILAAIQDQIDSGSFPEGFEARMEPREA